MIEAHDYDVNLKGTGSRTGVLEAEGLPPLDVASPPEFGGPDGVWSPEHLYVASLSSCLMTTFRVIAEIARVEVLEYSDQATGHLRRGDDRLYRMEKITLRPRVVIADPDQVEKAHRLLEKADQVCLINRSV
ncbi:MAG TPA: OsmC family peroxiredoxin, partial [Acidimicrobiia bacterium]|nr:OsmC family peroxiredoxin [Acidimicrobiia bacterium]